MEAKELLLKFSDTDLARIACEINCWEFPVELKELAPDVYEKYNKDLVYTDLVYLEFKEEPRENPELSNFFEDTLSKTRIYIENLIGARSISRYWNTTYRTDEGKMTDEQFNIWWSKK